MKTDNEWQSRLIQLRDQAAREQAAAHGEAMPLREYVSAALQLSRERAEEMREEILGRVCDLPELISNDVANAIKGAGRPAPPQSEVDVLRAALKAVLEAVQWMRGRARSVRAEWPGCAETSRRRRWRCGWPRPGTALYRAPAQTDPMTTPDLSTAALASLVERLDAFAGLLKAYGNVANTPTEHELWAGCKDAAPWLEAGRAALAAAEKELTALRAHESQHHAAREYIQHADEIIAGLRSEVEALREKAGAVEADKARMDHLESEWAIEERWRRNEGPLLPDSLFRRNVPITRATIDAAIREAAGERARKV